MLHRDLYNWLVNAPDLDGLFPGGVHHNSLPQDVSEYPAMSFFQVSNIEIGEDYDAPYDQKIDQAQYQFDVIAKSSDAAVVAAYSFLGIFRNFRGTMSTTRVQMVSLSNISHLEERRGDKVRRRVSLDFSITFDTE